ncbi:MAG: 3-oxoacyl-ACP reductase FabG [Candidatus Methylomirabilales bacterium]
MAMAQDRVAVVTGAGRGIGKAVAERLAARGDVVVVVDVDAAAAEGAANGIRAAGGRAGAEGADVSSYKDVEGLMARVARAHGGIDVLVNNAGIIRRGTLQTVTEQDWDAVLAVNLKGTFNCCKHAVPWMLGRGGGRIVNVASIAARLGDITSAPGYGPSKAGMVNLTKTLARELAPHGITVNAVAPHAIATEMSAQWSEERRQQIIRSIPLGRLGLPEEVAAAVAFLASGEAGFITGATLDINGGALMD